MHKLILAGILFLAACNNNKADTSKQEPATNASGLNADEMDFVDACVDNAKGSLGEDKAFVLCKCILLQMKEENPRLDSASMMKISTDTAKIAAFARNCK